jgi:MFS family permease
MIGAQGIGIGAFAIILPTLINEFGFSALETQLYSMIPYAFGFFSMISIPYIADQMHRKGVTTIACLCITCISFILLLSTTNKPALLAGTCFVVTGAYPGLAVSAAWFLTFHGGYTKRATAVWISQIFVQAYSIISTQVYRTPPRFFLGHAVSLGLYGLAIACSLILLKMLTRANKSRDLIQMEYEAMGERNPQMEVDFEELGDFHPSYRYAL